MEIYVCPNINAIDQLLLEPHILGATRYNLDVSQLTKTLGSID